MIPDLSQRYLDEKYSEKFIISSTKDAGELLLHRYSCINTETLMLMLLDGKGRQLFCGTVMEGSIHSLDISIKSIVKIASRYQASAAIIAHNHPSGIALPSSEDLNTTEAVHPRCYFDYLRKGIERCYSEEC